MNSRHFFWLFFIFILSWQFALKAQDVTGTIEGRIVDESGSAVPNVVITISSPDLQGTRFTQTNEEGYFRLILLPPGFYTAKITHIAYRPGTIDNIQVRLGKTSFLSESILIAKPYELEEVLVNERKNLIDPNSTVTGGNFTKEEIEPLPLQRNFQSIPLLLPQINSGFYMDEISYAGSTGLENRYSIDGIEVTDPLYFSQGIILPYNFIKDIEVITGGYEAQYRSSLGGVVNVITQSGSDKFSGQVFGFYTAKKFTADARLVPGLEPDEGDYYLYDVGFSVGGPLLKEKLWLNLAYNPNFQNDEVLIPGIGYETDKLLWNQLAGKLSWNISEKAQLVMNYTGEFYNADRVGEWIPSGIEYFKNPDPALTKVSWENYAPSIRGYYFFSNKFFIEGSFSRFQLNLTLQPRTETGKELTFFNYEEGTVSGGVVEKHDELAVRYSSNLKATLSLDDHIIKAGIEYLDNSFSRNQDVNYIEKYTDSLYYSYLLEQHGNVGSKIPAVYFQDSWRINKNWLLNGGLRWEGQLIIDSNGKIAQKILDNLQPRFGLVFSPSGDDNDKLFASYGRFYQELADAVISYYYLGNLLSIYREYDHDPRVNPNGGDTIYIASGQIQDEISGFKGQFTDEISLGFEKRIWNIYKFSLRGLYRWLSEGVEDAYSNDLQKMVLGNPGRDPLSEYPNLRREYMAFEFVFQKVSTDPLNFSLSYVLSRNYGNYPGLFGGSFAGNASSAFDYPEMTENATGLLPYDRTHALKFSGSYRFDFGLNLGVICSWLSGTPLNEFGVGSENYGRIFLQPQGSAGRTPDIWDVNLRLAYILPSLNIFDYQARLILDAFHIASKQIPVNYDQYHYLGADENGNQIYPNPTYREPTAFQPPMSFRFGMEINF